MSNVQRMWAGSLHTIEPDRLLNGIYVREQVVFAKDYDALRARLAEAERIMADFLRSWDSSFAGENIDPFRMDEVRAFLRGSVNGSAVHGDGNGTGN